ncbi:hypothetical protein LJC74_06165 [Eubacteriales bacterium OttesenSCG-928-A19]|nr:hypothetical protein [Eubacteriales bacterium OttesenSCG-928-A19]
MYSDKLKDSKFARVYVWMAKAKYTMGILFVAFVFVYLFFGWISEGPMVTLDLFTSVQMLIACFLIGVLQQAILPAAKLSRVRGICWVLSGVLITLVFSLVFGWFDQLPLWCFIVFVVFIAIGMAAMIVGYYLELHRETKRLNRGLEQFRRQKPGTEG